MSNPHKGEVGFKAGDKDYILSFSADAFVEIEVELGKRLDDVIAIFQDPEKIRLADLRVMFWKGLGDHQPDLTFADARAILRKLNATEMADLVGRAFVLAMPQADEGDVKAQNPQKPGQDGTGSAS